MKKLRDNIIHDYLYCGELPIYNTDENESYYTVTDITDRAQAIKLENTKYRVVVPLFEQEVSKEYIFKRNIIDRLLSRNSFEEQYNLISKDWCDFLKKIQKVPENILKLFEDIGCKELRVISAREYSAGFTQKYGIIMCHNRSLGYLGRLNDE